MTPTSPIRSRGRRIALATMLAIFASVLFSATALAAPIIGTITGPGDPVSPFGYLSTVSTTANGFSFTVTGVGVLSATCQLDGGAIDPCLQPTPGNFTYAGPLPGSGHFDLGTHELKVIASDSAPSSSLPKYYTWRIEPRIYRSHMLFRTPRVYFPLDDAIDQAGSQTAVDLTGHVTDGGYVDTEGKYGAPGGNYTGGTYFNYVLQRQPALVRCENQPHPPYACKFSGADSSSYKGYSAYFGGNDGSNDSVQFHDGKPPTNNWAVEMWIKPSEIGDYQGLYEHEGLIWIDPTGAVNCTQFGAVSDPANPVQALHDDAVSTATLSPGSTYHIACVRQGNTVTLYINGIAQSHTGAVGGHDAWNNGDDQGKIGVVNVPFHAYFKGWIDDVGRLLDLPHPLAGQVRLGARRGRRRLVHAASRRDEGRRPAVGRAGKRRDLHRDPAEQLAVLA